LGGRQNFIDLDVKLQESENFKPKMNPVFINAYKDLDRKKPIKEANWKMEATQEGTTKIKIKVQDKIFEKNLIIGASRRALSNKKMEESNLEHFIYPAEKLLDGSNELKYIYIRYPGKNISFAGISTHWLVFNLILVVIVVLALKNRFGRAYMLRKSFVLDFIRFRVMARHHDQGFIITLANHRTDPPTH
jgi:hypothetical protein